MVREFFEWICDSLWFLLKCDAYLRYCLPLLVARNLRGVLRICFPMIDLFQGGGRRGRMRVCRRETWVRVEGELGGGGWDGERRCGRDVPDIFGPSVFNELFV